MKYEYIDIPEGIYISNGIYEIDVFNLKAIRLYYSIPSKLMPNNKNDLPKFLKDNPEYIIDKKYIYNKS